MGNIRTEATPKDEVEELKGKLSSSFEDNKLMRSVLQSDKQAVDDAKLISESINQGLGMFNPDMMYEQLVTNYTLTEKLQGKTIIQLLTGMNPSAVKRNIRVPEFQKELKQKLHERVEQLKDIGVLTDEGFISRSGVEVAAIQITIEELESLYEKGQLGKASSKKTSHYGEKDEVRLYKKGDRYKDLAIRNSIRLAIKRGHKELESDDLKTFTRMSKTKVNIIYCLDASSSMKGAKLDKCKRAGIALAFKAIDSKDKVGLIAFGSEVKKTIEPTDDFGLLIKEITRIRATNQTDFVKSINRAAEMFSPDETNHLILLTDALPTVGKEPERAALDAAATARNQGITISLIGIDLDPKGREFAKQFVELGGGKLYLASKMDDIDHIVLEDYSEL